MIHYLRIVRCDEDLLSSPGQLTLRQFWEEYYRPEFATQSPKSLASDRNCLNNWERYLSEPNRPSGPLLGEITRQHPAPIRLRDAMLDAGRSGSTVRKNWRELKAILALANEKGFCEVPSLPRRRPICPASLAAPRELVSEAELEQLFDNCDRVSYPDTTRHSRLMWRVLLAVDWCFGPRTLDLIRMRWDYVLWHEGLLRFTARKTNKLQGLPMPPVLRQILERWQAMNPNAERLFPSIAVGVRGHFDHKRSRWVNGWRTCWRRDINHGIEPVDFQHIRQAVVSRWRESGVGSWIAGHAERGVSDKHYTQPSQLLRRVIESWEPPRCLREFAERPWSTD